MPKHFLEGENSKYQVISCVADERVEEKALGRDQKPQGLWGIDADYTHIRQTTSDRCS
jgi:hypothetical protein